MKKLLVIDGNSILNRAFYGIRILTNKEGLPTNAIYGMITIISKHLENISPDYCAVAFDLKAPTFRHKMYDGYKANRKGMPDDLAKQLPYAKECMEALGIRVISKEGYEADDILGTFSRMASDEGIRCYVLTGDRDSLQLIDDNVSVLLAKTKETVEFDRPHFINEYGIDPSIFVDVKALMGDSSDNIPGVSGIGEKTALKLVADHGTLDSIYSVLDSLPISASVKQKLVVGKEMAYLSKTLATIDRNVPISQSIDSIRYNGHNDTELYRLFTKLEFSALIKKFGLAAVDGIKETSAAEGCHSVVDDSSCVNEISGDEALRYFKGKFASVCLNDEGSITFCDNEVICKLDLKKELSIAKEILYEISIICFDYKNLIKAINAYSEIDINELKCGFDCMLAAYVLDSNRNNYSFKEVYLRYMNALPKNDLPDACSVYDLWTVLSALVQKEGCEEVLYNIEQPLASVLSEMELKGFKINVNGIVEYGRELSECADGLESRIHSYAGEIFNINSPKQLGEVLFEKMGLPAAKKTKTGYSTDAEVLQKLINYHPIIEDILDYRQVTKLRSTYADGLAKAADEKGRVHSIFNQTGTATGRLSSLEPNLQNIPIKTELGRRFRQYFIPSNDEYVLIDADYSQIELRLLAHISGDKNMIDAFLSGEDIHTSTASRVFGIPPEDVTPEMRKRAKAVNFGIVYGIGEYSLSEDLGISRAEAKRYIQSYLEKYDGVAEYLDRIKDRAHKDGFVVTEYGRKRYIPEIKSSNKNLQHFGERVAMNSPIQGTAADIIKIAMIEVQKKFRDKNIDAKFILQVHDELLVESHKNCADEAYRILISSMENVVKLSVPLLVDAHIGENWYEAK